MDYQNCELCPRRCGVDRTALERGWCGAPGTALVAKAMRLDPAVMASPFITTIVDAVSLLIYFLFAQAMLPI